MELGLIFVGFLVGGLIGASGMGGGSLLAPLLIGVVGVGPLQAVSTDFVFSAATKALGGWRHWRLGGVEWPLVLRLLCASGPGVVAGVALLHWLGRGNRALTDGFVMHTLGVALICAAAATVWQALRPAQRPVLAAGGEPRWALLLPAGFVLGLLVGVTSVGSGSLFLVLLTASSPLPLRRAVGTDVAHAALLTGIGAVAHLSAGAVDLRLSLNLIAGSLPGVWLGSSLPARLPRRALSGVVASVLAVSGLRFL
ncbi:MAG TPA: sulfite exporter TauE/SafE family protein [Dehalococcoidia bacterium]|nr:sulfite exporter TauE/SafE family protein [Dehalococcoidia bacterium]